MLIREKNCFMKNLVFKHCPIISMDVECCLNCNFRFVLYAVVGDCQFFEKLGEVKEQG